MMPVEEYPDTIFLPDRAAMAINCLVKCLDRSKSYLPYCRMDLTGDPPRMIHSAFDWSDHTARVIDALYLAKAMTGSNDGEQELQHLLELFRQGFGEDGLHYTPDNPWSFRHANMHYQRSVINGLLSWYLHEGSEEAKSRLRALMKALKNAAAKRDDFWYFPAVERLPDGWPRGDWNILGWGADPANTNGRLLFGITKSYEEFGHPEAFDLANNFANHVMYHSSAYLPDGSFSTGLEFREGHFHSRAVTMLGVIRYGYGFKNKDAIEWGRRVYGRAQSYGSSFGWFPERLVRNLAHGCETCAIVDMMEASIWLALCGYPEYWEDTERYLRNQFLESQLTSTNWYEPVNIKGRKTSEWETSDDVIQRSVGGFAGWSQPNDLVSKIMHNWDLYMCCCAQGVRGLFNVWTHAVTVAPDKISVNLLINHWSPDATVKSWLPHVGRIQVTLKRQALVAVRIPPWVDRSTLEVKANGSLTFYKLDEPFVLVEPLSGGTQIELLFSVPEVITDEKILESTYKVRWLGNTVMGIDPQGTNIPLYNREQLRETHVPMIKRQVPPISFSL